MQLNSIIVDSCIFVVLKLTIWGAHSSILLNRLLSNQLHSLATVFKFIVAAFFYLQLFFDYRKVLIVAFGVNEERGRRSTALVAGLLLT